MYPHTKEKINQEIEGKEFVIQHTKRGWRCISWHPHYIITDWFHTKDNAIIEANKKITEYYNKILDL